MTANEIFIVYVGRNFTSFTINYRSDEEKSVVEFTLGVHTLTSYSGIADFSFDDMPSAVTFFKDYAYKNCARYEGLLQYRIAV